MAEKQFTTFYLGHDLFGINILLVREINRNLSITPVEHAPEYVAGLLNLRGQIVTVLDLGVKLGLPMRDITPASRCIILKTGAASVDLTGLLVDSVSDMAAVEERQIEAAPANAVHIGEKYLIGVIKLEKYLVGVLDIGKILKGF